MEKAAVLQTQIRENNNELNDFLKDLKRWEENVKNEDKNLKSARKLEEKLPPVRSKQKVKKNMVNYCEQNEIAKKEKQTRISSYDYDAWSKFDVDAACKSDSEEENKYIDSEEEVEEDDEELDQIQQQRRSQQAVMEKEKGNQLFKEGKYEAAINRYTTAISLDPANPILYANRGMALLKTEKFGAAEQDCNTALQLDPSYGKAIARRGAARKMLKKYKEAHNDYKHLLKLEPKNQQALNEIKSIEKILAAEKVITSKNVNASTSQVNSSDKTLIKPAQISMKPLKRIHITEVGIDEVNIDNKKEKSQLLNDKSLGQTKRSFVEASPSKLTVPTTSFMFETIFKRLKNDNEQLYSYLKIIPLTEYGKLFHQCIDSLISPFLNVLRYFYMRDALPYHKEMDAFTDVKRFDMAVMFLSSKDKQTLTQLFDNLSSKSYKFTLDLEFLERMASRYSIKL